MKLFTFLLLLVIAVAHAEDKESGKTKQGFWDRTEKAAKRIGKGAKHAGKEIGRGFQEVFDPNDEDLQEERKKQKEKD